MQETADEVRRYLALDYDTVIVPDTCGSSPCFVAKHPELPGCMSHGSTPEEAIANLRDATELYIESLLEDGLDVPLPHGVATAAPGRTGESLP